VQSIGTKEQDTSLEFDCHQVSQMHASWI